MRDCHFRRILCNGLLYFFYIILMITNINNVLEFREFFARISCMTLKTQLVPFPFLGRISVFKFGVKL